MARIMLVAALVFGLVSCQPELVLPGASPEVTLPPPSSAAPGRPSPSIEVPPPVN
jgi:hypothetical protein